MFKKIATYFIVSLMALIFLLDILTVALYNHYEKRYAVTPEPTVTVKTAGADRIHFLNTGNSDAILLESDGHFALIDAGDSSDNYRRKHGAVGYEQIVLDYVKKTAINAEGKIVLDFILPTHCHYDHIGGFRWIINDPDITIQKAYLKPFNPEILKNMEKNKWGLDIVYKETVEALEKQNIPIVSDLPDEPFTFGSFNLQFFNTVTDLSKPHGGENVSSVGVKVTKGKRTAFLAADISAEGGLENRMAPLVGKVDLLKVGHHGYTTATNPFFIRTLHPEIAIVTNQLGKIYPNVKWNLVMIAHASVYATVNHNGIIATFTDDGRIQLTDQIHDGSAKFTIRE